MWHGSPGQVSLWLSDGKITWSIDHLDYGTTQETWSHGALLSETLKFTSTIPDWPESASKAVKATPFAEIVDFKLMCRNPREKWVSPFGRVIQLGDASHTFLPSSGSGGPQALENAISLAACLRMTGKDSIMQTIQVYNLLRFERVSYFRVFGVSNREAWNLNMGKNIANLKRTLGKRLVQHHPEACAKEMYAEAAEALKTGAEFESTNRPPGLKCKPRTIHGLVEAMDKGAIEGTILDVDWGGQSHPCSDCRGKVSCCMPTIHPPLTNIEHQPGQNLRFLPFRTILQYLDLVRKWIDAWIVQFCRCWLADSHVISSVLMCLKSFERRISLQTSTYEFPWLYLL